MKRLVATTAIAALLAISPALAEMNSPTSARHVLSLNDVEITALIDDVSIITGHTFVLHPDVRRTKVTVMSQTPMTTDEVFQVFLSTLRVHGFAAIPAGRGVYRVVPEQSAVGEALTTSTGANGFMTEILRLDNFSAVEAAQMVKPIVDAQGQVVANARSNTLIVVDYASNMPRVRNIVAGLDKAGEANIRTLQLATVPAREMRDILNGLMGGRDGSNEGRLEVTASSTSNAIVLSGPEPTVARAIQVATELDQTDRVRDTLRVIQLANSDAVDIVPILERIAQSMSGEQLPSETGNSAATISHHEPTNSLVISAPPDVLLAMERVVESLDQRRAQVLVEAIIVEMSDDTARELGVQFLLSGVGDSTVPFLSTNFSDTAPNLLGLAGAIADPEALGGTNPFTDAAVTSLLGLEGIAFGGGGRDGDTLFGAILTAVETDRNSRVLSKPFNMTLDNGTSQLVVGQEIPITTGEVLGDSNSNPFRTVQREKIGIKLEVTPRISSDDTVRLDIYQEVSSIPASGIISGSEIIFNTREITTSVLADDRDIIVIGGLIEQTESEIRDQVPVLGDIPVVGNLFRSDAVERRRTNLMVFIRPTIIRNAEDAQEATGRNYRYLQAEAMLRSESDEEVSAIDGFVSETLGELPPGALRGRSD
ncbi:MAG: type II secretion system secretin GspD [Pseudomonadota bacterium]